MIKLFFLKKGLLISFLIFGSILLNAQMTVQIGMGTQAPLTNNSIYSPICRFSDVSGNDCSRSNLLYTNNELANVGITAGSTINKIAFYKIGNGASTAGFTFEIRMRNSATTAPLSTATTWANIVSTHTQVYATTSQTIPATTGWVEFTLTTPFVYTGQNLEIAMSHDMTAIVGNPSTGPFDWQYTNGFQDYIIGSVSTTLPATLSGTVVNYKVRPNIQISYLSGAACNGMPLGGTTNGDLLVCPGVAGNYSVSGSTSASGLSYQWQSSPNGFVWSDIVGATGPSYSQTITVPLSLRRRIICNAGPDTAYSTALSVSVNPFLNCYCTSNATAATNTSIRNVTFAGLNNTSSSACDQYTNVTADTAFVNKGLDYPVSVLVEDCEGTGFSTQRVAIFIDWNQNGLFTDPGELIYDPGTLPGAATVLFSGNISVPLTAATGLTKMRVINVQSTAVINPCGTYTTGETEDYFINVQPPPANEAGVLAITKPAVGACSLGQQIWVNVQNLGTNDLTSANFTVKVNGLNIPVNNPWTGNVPAQSIAEVQIPISYVMADGDSISVEVSLPNGQAESPVFSFNNHTARRVFQALTGVKTVYGVGANFSNVDAAINALVVRGVCDTVFFKIASGTYTTQHTFVEYPNAGPGKLAVFEAASGNPADVSFTHSGTVAADNFVFRFDEGDGYMLRNLTAVNQGATFARVVDILNESNNLSFDGNIFVGDTSGAYSTTNVNLAVVGSTGSTNDNFITLRNNTIFGGSRGVSFNSATGTFESDIIVEDNTFSMYAYAGLHLGASNHFNVEKNTFSPNPAFTQDAFGAFITGSINGGTVLGNTVQSPRKGAGIMLDNVKGVSDQLLAANNFVYLGDTLAANVSSGITVQNINSVGVILSNNSISIQSNNASSAGISILDGSEISVFNNNIGSFGSAPVARVDKSYSVAMSNNNNLFGTTISNLLGAAFTTMADHQAATNMDAASISVNPGFNGMDLHTCEPQLNGAAISLTAITDDYDGELRSATPDIGADEFLGDANDLLVENDFLKCPADQVTIGNTAMDGVVYSWTPSGNTSQITTANAGTFIVTATSSCGSFSDTATVVNKPLPTANFTSATVGLTGIFNNTSTNATSYLWDFGDGNTSTDANPTHVYSSAGTYSVSLTITNECGTATFGPTQVNVINAGIDENVGMEILLFPNPTSDRFTISFSPTVNETVITVIDITGKIVLTKNIPAGINQTTMDATTFASGVYSVKINNAEFTKTIRLVRK